MKFATKNSGFKIGITFTVISLLLTKTSIIPIVSIIPVGVSIEIISASLVSNTPYSNVGKLTVAILTVVFISVLTFSLMRIRKKSTKAEQISKAEIVVVMTLVYFIIHPLAFYIYWGGTLNFKNDGQLLFGAVNSHPMSSMSFIPIGLLIDWVKNKNLTNFAQIEDPNTNNN